MHCVTILKEVIKMNQTLIEFYNDYREKKNAYQFTLNTLYFDLTTIAPKDGIPYRNHIISIIYGEYFSHVVNKESITKLEELLQMPSINKELQKELKLQLRELDDMRFLPKDIYIDFIKVISTSESAWGKAKMKNDYQIFKPHLKQIIEKQKEVLHYVDKACSDYDYMLDHFQMGVNIAFYDSFFRTIKQEILPLIKRIQTEGKIIDTTPLFQPFDIAKQKQFIKELKSYLQINENECYMGLSNHSLTAFFSAHESRITINFHENNVMSAIFSTIHEYGHALYGLQLSEAYQGSPFAYSIGYAMHESQSRFMENHIAHARAFWEINYPKLQSLFPEQLALISLDAFMDMINAIKPTLIRIGADELTYPIHILIRYEIEKEIFNGTIDINDLETLWNKKYEDYLGIRPTQQRDGILQDIHWSSSNFGYFPTYALGSALAAQFYHQVKKEIPVDKLLREGNFLVIKDWLKENIHTYGALKEADELMLEITHEHFNPNYYISYLKNKYMSLYQLR